MSSLINKAKQKIEATLDKNSNQSNHPHSSNEGPHSSNLMNKTDPRVDSDRNHRNDPSSRVGGMGTTQGYNTIHDQTTAPGGHGGAGHTGGYGGGMTSGHTSGHNVGHNTGYSEHAGGIPGQGVGHTGHTGGLPGHSTGHNVQGVGHTGTAGGLGGAGGYGGASNTYDNPQSTNSGPHRSNLANKLDPRHDSDNDNRNDPTSRVGGYGGQSDNYGQNTGLQGGHTGVGHTGVGHSGVGHDPSYGGNTGVGHGGIGHDSNYGGNTGIGHSGVGHDSSYGGNTGIGHSGVGHDSSYGGNTGYGAGGATGAVGGQGYNTATPGSGNARNTAGPHNSDLLNKLDPRVDADMDGSKTYGGNATHR